MPRYQPLRDRLPVCTAWSLLAATLLASAGTLTGCSSPAPTATPMLDTRNPELRLSQRLEAADLAWESVQDSPGNREKAREIFKSLVWSDNTPPALRRQLAEKLLNDSSPEGLADSRSFTTLRLPTEPDRSIVGLMALAAAKHGWTDAAPSLVRRLAEPIPGVAVEERVEALAIQRLFPGRSLEQTVFAIFLGRVGESMPGGAGELFDDRIRADAWTVLSRLDPEGETRRRLVMNADAAASGAAGVMLADLQAAADELHVVPSTAMELAWLRRLRSEPANTEWWRKVSGLVSGLDDGQRDGLAMRHLEAIRIASIRHPEMLRMDTEGLYRALEARLEGRSRNRRTAEIDAYTGRVPERPQDWKDELDWGDLLAVLMIDDAVHWENFAYNMLRQAELDRQDRKTEYGGVIEAVSGPNGSVTEMRAVLFPPRPRDRVSDERFIASQDMLDYSDRSLAHYHMQVQKEKNYQYAGPSSGDLRYTALSGRSCVVFTSLGSDRLAVDYYQPDGVTIDLGEIESAD